MNGIIIANKPKNWTSFDVVAKIRNLTRVKKVGHSGTLDPMATGVLPIFLGSATKTIRYFIEGDKAYLGEMTLGVKTDTGDAEGKRVSGNPEVKVSVAKIEEILKKYTGEIEQIPPMYSAVKVKGERLYKLARQGIVVKREPRKVKIYDLHVTQDDLACRQAGSQIATPGRISFFVACSKGTYIRQLVQDIGDDLGCGAHLSQLERIYAHPFHISQAVKMETIITLAGVDRLASIMIQVEDLLSEQRAS
jgi:tRNA pseudouridine55 synthase